MEIHIGLTATSHLLVADEHTAQSLGSGDMPVLATPALAALMENAAMKAVAPNLNEGQTTVGAHLDLNHLRPTAVGRSVQATAQLERVEGRKLFFHVTATDDRGPIGEASHLRVVVDRDRFLTNL